MIQFPNKNMSVVENQIVERLVSDILAAGLTVSVNDGEDYPLRYSTDMKAIVDALASTDGDELVLHEPKNAQGMRMRVGWISLVWGNDTAVISDYTVNATAWVRSANALADHMDCVERGFRPRRADNSTARFWVNLDGGNTVLVKLQKGQEVTHVDGRPTDEGFDYTARTWSFDGNYVVVSWINQAMDCDGKITRRGSSYCALAELQEGYRSPDGESTNAFACNGVILPIIFPRWRERNYEQRDHAAEAAGY